MTQKEKRYILVTILVVLFIGVAIFVPKNNPILNDSKIEYLETQIDSIYITKDSLVKQIDTLYIKLEDNRKQYEEDVNLIISNDMHGDSKFFHEYINSNRSRLDSISNCL